MIVVELTLVDLIRELNNLPLVEVLEVEEIVLS